MIDLEKLKEKQAKELVDAQKANAYEEKLGNEALGLHLLDSFSKAVPQRICIHQKDLFKPLTVLQAGEVLCKFPSTDNIKVHLGTKGEVMLPYKLQTSKSYRDPQDKIQICYISDGIEVDFYMEMDLKDDELMQFFNLSHRTLRRDEYPETKRTRWNVNQFDHFPFYQWNSGKVICFQGGYNTQYAEGIIGSFIEMLKYKYQFAQS